MRLPWDAAKAESNRKTHGVAFEESLAVFHDPLAATFVDSEPSKVRMWWSSSPMSPKRFAIPRP